MPSPLPIMTVNFSGDMGLYEAAMHTFENLKKKFETMAVERWAEVDSVNLPLVRAPYDRKDYIETIFRNGVMPKPKPSDTCRGDATIQREGLLGIDPPVYFYAGRVHPRAGGVVFVWPRDSAEDMCGSVTPFDSGGICEKTLLVKSDHERVGYFQEHEAPLENLREYLQYHLSSFFDSLDDYLDGPPPREIDGCKFTSSEEFYDWTFEIRIGQDVPIGDMIVFLDQPLYTIVTSLFESEDIDVPENSIRRSGYPCQAAENWVQEMTKSMNIRATESQS